MNSSIFFNKAFRRAALASAVALGAFGASSSFAATTTADSTATVIEPIAIALEAGTSLDFGKFAPGTAEGTVTVSTSGARTGSNTFLSSIGSNPDNAQFNVTGDNDATYIITLPDTVSLTDAGTGGGSPMTVTLFSDFDSSDSTTGGQVATGELGTGGVGGSAGAQSIYIGGTLAVGVDQVASDYAGSMTATVEYN